MKKFVRLAPAAAQIIGLFLFVTTWSSTTAWTMDARPADGSSVVVEDALTGDWTVVVKGEKRTRTLVVEGLSAPSADTINLQANYGWTDAAQVKSPTSLSVGPSQTILNIFTPSKNKITATWMTPELFEGVFDLGNTTKQVTIRKNEPGSDDKPTPAKSIKKLTVLYVGAFNCPSCDEWKRRDQRAEAQIMSKVELRQVQTNTYSYIAQDSAWPDDLKPIRDRLKLKSGTPRFIVMADDKIVLHRFGKASWQKDVLPKLAELTASNRGGK